MKLSRKRDPTPPENVRLVLRGGTEIPLECRYDGLIDGIHRWVAVTPAWVEDVHGLSMKVGMFPAKTSISAEVDLGGV